MGRGARQVDTGGHASNSRNQLVDLVPHQQTAVTGFGPLAIFDLNGTGIFLHLRDGVNDFIPAKIPARNLQNHIL